MSNARRRALFKWYKDELGFSSAEARKARNRSRGWYDDFKSAQRANPQIKPPRWTPSNEEQRQRSRELRRLGIPSKTATKLRRLPGIRFEGAVRSIKGTKDQFTGAVGKREATRAFNEAFARTQNFNDVQAAINAIYAQFRPERVTSTRRSRAERAGVRTGRVR